MDLLSVIVPIYNCEKYIGKCVESILEQTYSKIEIILVDDGSSDQSGSICDKYNQKYESISVIHQSHSGVIGARLCGVENSNGTIITFVDSDDWMKKDYYENMLEDVGDCDLIISGINRYVDESRCIEEKVYYREGVYDKEKIVDEIIPSMMWSPDIYAWGLDPSLCTKIFRKEMILKELQKVKDIDSHYGDDSMVIYPLIFNVQKMRVIKQAYYFHRQKPVGTVPAYIEDELFLDKLHSVYTYLKKEFYQAGYIDILRNQLERFYFHSVELKVKGYNDPDYRFFCMFPFLNIERNSKVILYGAGKVGRAYMEQNEMYHFCNIIHWVDRNYKNVQYKEKVIEDPNVMKETQFDYVIIAINDYYTAIQIAEYIRESGIPKNKIVWQNIRKCASQLLKDEEKTNHHIN